MFYRIGYDSFIKVSKVEKIECDSNSIRINDRLISNSLFNFDYDIEKFYDYIFNKNRQGYTHKEVFEILKEPLKGSIPKNFKRNE